MFLSVDWKLPANVAVLLASRAVSWNPQARCVGSATVTVRCCLTPGEYVSPFGKFTVTLPRFPGLLAAPEWHCRPRRNYPALSALRSMPGSGPYSCAQIKNGMAPMIAAILPTTSFRRLSIIEVYSMADGEHPYP